MFPLPRLVRPAKGDHYQCHHLLDPEIAVQVRLLQMEPPAFQALEQVLDFPAQAIGFQRLPETLVVCQDHQFATVQPHAAEPDPLLADAPHFPQQAAVARRQAREQAAGSLGFPSATGFPSSGLGRGCLGRLTIATIGLF